jgi:hypothetical protein
MGGSALDSSEELAQFVYSPVYDVRPVVFD